MPRLAFYLATPDCILWLTRDIMHEVLSPTVEAWEIICTIDRMKIGFCTKKNVASSSPRSPPRHFFSPSIYFFFIIIFLFDAAQCRVSEDKEKDGQKKGELVGDLKRLRRTNKQLNWLTGDGGTDESCDQRSDSAKIHNLPTSLSGKRNSSCFFNLITGSKCLLPNIDTDNHPQEKLTIKHWRKSIVGKL